MGASISPVSGFHNSQYDISILVWKVNAKAYVNGDHKTCRVQKVDAAKKGPCGESIKSLLKESFSLDYKRKRKNGKYPLMNLDERDD